MLRALTFDYWDTIYEGAAKPERMARRQAALRRMLDRIGRPVSEEEFLTLYSASGAEAERWWREEHRGYTAAERIRWMLAQLKVERPEDCEHVAAACRAVDDALIEMPPMLIAGARSALQLLAPRSRLAIVSDTGFASGVAQDRLLERDGLLTLFRARIYSVDLGHAKPRPEPFNAAMEVLDVVPADVLHVGDNERTDVRGALETGMRAVRVDFNGSRGPSAAEFVARSFAELRDYLLEQLEEGGTE
jgi:FMN phosphatase YigB (HAD superfamily)